MPSPWARAAPAPAPITTPPAATTTATRTARRIDIVSLQNAPDPDPGK